MPLVPALSYNPTLKTVTIAGDIPTISLMSISNQTRGKDLFVIGQTPVTDRVFSGGNTTFTLNTNTAGDSVNDVLAVRYQPSSVITSVSNPYIVNGVAHFVQSTKPTTRIGGSPLVIGDKWYKSDEGIDWFWNGTYWRSRERNWQGYLTGSSNFANSQMTLSDAMWQMRYQFMLTSVYWTSNIVTCNSNNYWNVIFGPRARANFTSSDTSNNLSFDIPLFSVNQSGFVAPQSATLNIVPTQNNNTLITDSALYLTLVGTPSTARIFVSLFFASIYP